MSGERCAEGLSSLLRICGVGLECVVEEDETRASSMNMFPDAPNLCETDLIYEGTLDSTSIGGGGHQHFVGMANALVKHLRVGIVYPQYGTARPGWGLSATCQQVALTTTRKSAVGVFVYELKKAALLVRTRWACLIGRRPVPIYKTRLHVVGLAVVAARLLGFVTVLEVNGWPPDEFKSRGFRRGVCRVVRITTEMQILAANSCTLVASTLSTKVRKSASKRVLLPNGTGLRFSPTTTTGMAPSLARRVSHNNAVQIAFVGALTPWRDLETPIRSLALPGPRASGWTLRIVGDGEAGTRLAELAEDIGVADRVEWVGWVGQNCVRSYLEDADVAIVPSIPPEMGGASGSPLKLFDYLACGLRTVASSVDDTVALAETLPLTLYECGDVLSFADAIRSACSQSPWTLIDLEVVAQQVHWDARAEQWLAAMGLEPMCGRIGGSAN